jgi:hypothetical protein
MDMNKVNKAAILAAALWCSGALAQIEDPRTGWQGTPTPGWLGSAPASGAPWTAPSGGWDVAIPVIQPVEYELPDLGDWNIGIQPPRHGGGEYRCHAIGCEDRRGGRDDIITIGDCNKGPC